MADMPMLSETAELAAGALPDRGKHEGFQAATAATAHGAASIPVVPTFVFSRFTGTMQPPFAGFVNLWGAGVSCGWSVIEAGMSNHPG